MTDLDNRPRMYDSRHPAGAEWWHLMYTPQEHEELHNHFSAIIDLILGPDRKRLVGLTVEEAKYLVECHGWKVDYKVIPKPVANPASGGMYDLVGAAFSNQCRCVGWITLCVDEGNEGVVARVDYGH